MKNDMNQPNTELSGKEEDFNSLLDMVLEDISQEGESVPACVDEKLLDWENIAIEEMDALLKQEKDGSKDGFKSSSSTESTSDTIVFPALAAPIIKPVPDRPSQKIRPAGSAIPEKQFEKLTPQAGQADEEDGETDADYEPKRSRVSSVFFVLMHVFFYAFILVVALGTVLFFMRANGTGVYTIQTGGSPGFQNGDLVIVDECPPSQVQIDDVILQNYNNTGVLLAQTVLETVDNNGEIVFITDGNPKFSDSRIHVTQDHFIGKVSFTLPAMGMVLDFADQYILIFGIAILIVIALFIFANWRHFSRSSKKDR